jgi:hypothetical protein
MLIDQYRERNNLDKPYGVIMFAYDDNGGAFRGEGLKFKEPYDQLKEMGYLLRIAEIQSVPDFARKLIRLQKKYGSGHRISFMVVGGHGSGGFLEDGTKAEDWVRFGPAEIPRHLRTFFGDYFRGKGVQRLGEFLEEDAPILLMSCSTGTEGGIAQSLSGIGGIGEVNAPERPAYTHSIKVAQGPDDKLKFEVVYDAGEDSGHTGGNGESRYTSMTYKDGDLVSSIEG